MKKLFLFSMMCLMALSMNAQRCAVLEFRGAQSVSVADVDGISEMFMTYFRPTGYTMIERAQIDKVISEQGFQRSSITEAQAVRLGKILNVSKVVLGKVSRLGGQYQVDVRVVDVESGHDVAVEGATFIGDYRTNMRNLATKLAAKIAIKPGAAVQHNESSDYVDLGLPSGTKWKSSNEKGGFVSYSEALSRYGNKLPTREQWEELNGMCTWTWTGKGYRVTGDNGKSIMLPAAGYRCEGEVNNVGSLGIYWSSTTIDNENAWDFLFDSKIHMVEDGPRHCGYSVRLVTY